MGIALALISSIKDTPLRLQKLLVAGEVGLTGEVRPITYCDRIANEADKMGLKILLYLLEIRQEYKLRI